MWVVYSLRAHGPAPTPYPVGSAQLAETLLETPCRPQWFLLGSLSALPRAGESSADPIPVPTSGGMTVGQVGTLGTVFLGAPDDRAKAPWGVVRASLAGVPIRIRAQGYEVSAWSLTLFS